MQENVEKKRYYWIKLKTDFFDIPTIDWLLEQKNGSDYVVLYQKLCLLTANNNGVLSRAVGEMIIPYNAEKISQITKTDIDTVVVGLDLFKNLGLIYEQEDSNLRILNIDEMIGSESKWAKYKRIDRNKEDKLLESFQSMSNKRLDIEIDIDKEDNIYNNNIKKEIYKEKKKKPTLEEIKAYCIERKNKISPSKFFNTYESNGWKIGQNPIEDWKACVRKWEENDFNKNNATQEANLPHWVDKKIEKQEMSKEEEQELKNSLKDFN